jgi:small membrane protein
MISGIQIILLVAIALLVVRTIRRVKDKQITHAGFIGWMFIWVTGAIVVITPESTSRVADLVGVGRGVDVVVYIALILIFYLLFRLFNRTIAIEKDITKLVRALALKNITPDDEEKS